jgi:hypothetical protein
MFRAAYAYIWREGKHTNLLVSGVPACTPFCNGVQARTSICSWRAQLCLSSPSKVAVRILLLNGEGDGGVSSSALLCYQNNKTTKLSLAVYIL